MGVSKLIDRGSNKLRVLENEVFMRLAEWRKIKIIKRLKLNTDYPVMDASPESEVYSIEIKCPVSEKVLSRYISPGIRLTYVTGRITFF